MNFDILPDFSENNLAKRPIELAETIPASWCTSPIFENYDNENIFSKTWQYVCSLDNLIPILASYRCRAHLGSALRLYLE